MRHQSEQFDRWLSHCFIVKHTHITFVSSCGIFWRYFWKKKWQDFRWILYMYKVKMNRCGLWWGGKSKERFKLLAVKTGKERTGVALYWVNRVLQHTWRERKISQKATGPEAAPQDDDDFSSQQKWVTERATSVPVNFMQKDDSMVVGPAGGSLLFLITPTRHTTCRGCAAAKLSEKVELPGPVGCSVGGDI